VPFTLQAIADLPESELRSLLTHLQAGEFLYETRVFPELEYTFKHALTHEVAYGSLLQERRRLLHELIVKAIEDLYADRFGEQIENAMSTLASPFLARFTLATAWCGPSPSSATSQRE
jgi:hypothetical protein